MFRLQHRVFQGFPGLCLNSRMPCTPTHSPSSNRTCGFPVSDKLSPQGVCRELTGTHSVLNGTQALQRRVVGLLPLEDLHPPLAPSAQEADQPASGEVFDPPKRLPGIPEVEVVAQERACTAKSSAYRVSRALAQCLGPSVPWNALSNSWR